VVPTQSRTYADAQDRSHNPKSEPIEHVSEEAAKTAKIMGEQGPDINQGTPVENVSMERDDTQESWLTIASL
jgi:small subunit ribosomal protein S7